MRMLVLALCALGCTEPAPTVVEFVNEGALCLDGSQIVVDWQTCLSSSCDTLTDSDCTATLDNGVLTLDSYGRIESQGAECTDDCGFASATCELPEISGR